MKPNKGIRIMEVDFLWERKIDENLKSTPAVDSLGNVYVVGESVSPLLPIGPSDG